MLVVSVGSPWFHAFILTSLHLERLSASTSNPALPTPTLHISATLRDSVILVCQAPRGHRGVEFMLYRVTEKVDSQTLKSSAEQAHFTVRTEDGGAGQSRLFCCLFKNQGGTYSAFSPYLQVEAPGAEGPTHGPPLLAPLLSVEPSSAINLGNMLRFCCTIPAPRPQSNNPATFLLLRTGEQTTSVIPQLQADQASNSEPQPGVFTVGPVGPAEEGEYSCIYQIHRRRMQLNSSVSNVLQITITNVLPVPSLVLQLQTDVWRLVCIGSAAYPGATFSLYLEDSERPLASHQAAVIQHQVTFSVPVQDSPVALYRCQYRVQLGRTWSDSDRSIPLAVTRGVDWSLLLGSVSAALFFLFSLVLLVQVAHRKVKSAAEEKKRRQEAQFWTQRQTQDQVFDLTLRQTSLTTQEWSSRDTETASTLWNPFSTFTRPSHPVH